MGPKVEVWSMFAVQGERGNLGFRARVSGLGFRVRPRQLRGLTCPCSYLADANAFNSRARAARSCARPRRE